MARRIHLFLIYGTRPEAVKLAPVVRAARADRERWRLTLVSTGQHREMLAPFVRFFGLEANHDLRVMPAGKSPAHAIAAITASLPPLLAAHRPDWLVVQGDTATAFAASLCAFFEHIRVAHVEAGLRTDDRTQPFPEEMNRRLIAPIADLHFAPTMRAKWHLISEGIPSQRIEITGNTSVDAVRWVASRLNEPGVVDETVRDRIDREIGDRKMVLITGHRRESRVGSLSSLCTAIASLARAHPEVAWVYPAHLDPRVSGPVRSLLGEIPNVHLIEPVGYAEFIYLLSRCTFAITDSGGVQEEAPSLGKPLLVTRYRTERPEGIAAGCAELVASDPEAIAHAATRLLTDPEHYRKAVAAENPYGRGDAAKRILARIALEEAHRTLAYSDRTSVSPGP
jgi:UDP-N-acetylglucosamine 2-epimerase (non-hydrolysing)